MSQLGTHDVLADVALEGLQAAWPGMGTPDALGLIGRTRGLVRWQDEPDSSYQLRLRGWLECWARARTREIAAQVHGYLRSKPMVRLISRAGVWVSVDRDGVLTECEAPWNWDSISHPERSGWWSDLWMVVFTDQYPKRPGTLGSLPAHDDGLGLGHMVPRVECDILRAWIGELKGAHSLIRAVIWCDDPTMFDPKNPVNVPDGTWGAWGYGDPSDCTRDLQHCRYWEIE